MTAMTAVRFFRSIVGTTGCVRAVGEGKNLSWRTSGTSSFRQQQSLFVGQSMILQQQRSYHSSPGLNNNNNNDYDDDGNNNEDKTVLVLGSSGALGSCIVSHLKKQNPNCLVIGADIISTSSSTLNDNINVDVFISLPSSDSSSSSGVIGLTNELIKGMKEESSGHYLDAIICASGGFALDDDDDDDNNNSSSNGDVTTKMMELNYYPVVAAAEMAKAYMAPKGLFVVIGAAAALVPGPGISAYCASKVAAHYYVQTLGTMSGISLRHKNKEYFPNENYLDELTAVAILPTILDTPTNRHNNNDNDDDMSSWIPLPDIAAQISSWLYQPYYRPHSGSLIKATKPTSSTNFHINHANTTKTLFTLVR